MCMARQIRKKSRTEFYLMILLLAVPLHTMAQKAVVEESVVDIVCDSRTHAFQHFKESITILSEQGASLAHFVCSCSKNVKLSRFKGQVTDGSGRVIRKIRESELQRTEYSPYLAIDDYKMYLEYTPPVYPVTITYEWTIESHDNLIEFPRFCPQNDYDVSVKKASYRLTAPRSLNIRHALLNIDKTVSVNEDSKYTQIFYLELNDLPALRQEPYARPLRERIPMAYFAPTTFIYYGTEGSLQDWLDYGKWEYSLIDGTETLPDATRRELHQLTDGLKTDREKIEAIYKRLEKTTRYVAILLGIGGQKPISAADVCKSGYGDCKGLSNYMRAMLKEVGIPSYYTIISTTNHRLLKDFASVGQMNHVILEVPLEGDTLWLECTNPQLPMGYVHNDIAGHDAIEVSESGGHLVRLPVYADSTNLMHSTIHIQLDDSGAADINYLQNTYNWQYEDHIPLLKMNEKDRRTILQRIVNVPEAGISRMDVSKDGARMTVDAEIRSQRYATVTGQRLFIPICPIHNSYNTPSSLPNRQEDILIKNGYLDEDEIILSIPEGYDIEACPKDLTLEQPFGHFSYALRQEGREIRIQNRLLVKSGTYDKSLYPLFVDFLATVKNIYGQKIVLKRK